MKAIIRKLKSERKALDDRIDTLEYRPEYDSDPALIDLQLTIMPLYSRILTKRTTLLEGRDGKEESK